MKTNLTKVFSFLVMISFTLHLSAQQLPEVLYYRFNSPGNQQNFASAPPSGTATAILSGHTIGSTGQFGTALIGSGLTSTSNNLSTGWVTNLPSTGWTISFWLNNFPATSATTAYYFGDASAASFRCFTGGVAPTGGLVLRGTGLTDVQITAIPATPIVIHIVYTGTAINVYRNGVFSSTVAQNAVTLTGTGPFLVGGYSSSNSINTGTLMDEFRLYNRALTAQEITATWNIELSNSRPDAGIDAILLPPDTFCAGNKNIRVRLRNYGLSAISQVAIKAKVNNDTLTTYNWTGNLPAGDSTLVNIGSYTFNQSTNYTIQAYTTLPNNLPDTINVNDTTVKSGYLVLPPFTGTVSPSNSITFCTGDSVLLSLNAPTATFFQWYFNGIAIPSATSNTYYAKQAGYYMLTYNNGICSNTSDTIYATSVPAPPATLSFYTPTTFCPGDSVFLFANTGTGLAYEWKLNNVTIPGATASTYAAKLGGIYTVVVSIPGSCSTTSAPVTVTLKPNHPVDLGPDKTVCGNAIVSLDAGSGANTYLWSTGAQTQTINVDSSGVGYGNKIITVITTKDSCASYDTVSITFIDCTGIEDLGQQQYIRVFPNPGKGDFSIELPIGITHGTVELRDFSGRLVYKEDFHSTSKSGLINLKTGLLAGVYILSVNIQNRTYNEKVIIH